MITRRQRVLLDLLIACHAVEVHPSPVHLSKMLLSRTEWPRGTSPRAIRLELGRLFDLDEIVEVTVRRGSAPKEYTLKVCPCSNCVKWNREA